MSASSRPLTCCGRLQKRSTTNPGVPGTSCQARIGSTWAALQQRQQQHGWVEHGDATRPCDRWSSSGAACAKSARESQQLCCAVLCCAVLCCAVLYYASSLKMHFMPHACMHACLTDLGPHPRLPPPPPAAATAVCAHCCPAACLPRPAPRPAPDCCCAAAGGNGKLLPSAAYR